MHKVRFKPVFRSLSNSKTCSSPKLLCLAVVYVIQTVYKWLMGADDQSSAVLNDVHADTLAPLSSRVHHYHSYWWHLTFKMFRYVACSLNNKAEQVFSGTSVCTNWYACLLEWRVFVTVYITRRQFGGSTSDRLGIQLPLLCLPLCFIYYRRHLWWRLCENWLKRTREGTTTSVLNVLFIFCIHWCVCQKFNQNYW